MNQNYTILNKSKSNLLPKKKTITADKMSLLTYSNVVCILKNSKSFVLI